ncbi:MAG TPA: mechanosensitive ion channel family protein [Thermoplasmatales archaeon]|nr:mechanosensitive ion channel family protein [Thermoplasmatales archaeon]
MASTDVATQVVVSVGDAVMQTTYSIISFLPTLVAAIIILVIGWIIGRLLGKVVSRVLDKIGVDDALRKTSIGKAIEQSGTNIVHLFDLIVRWFVYLIAIVAASNVLKLDFLSNLFQTIVFYLPHVLMFLIILIVGFIVVDYFADLLNGWGKTQNIEFLGVIILLLRIFFYFIILILALSQLLIDLTIIYTFITPLAWGVGLGVGAGIAIFLAYGLRDRAPGMVDDMMKRLSK